MYDNLMIKKFDLAQDQEHFTALVQGGVGHHVYGRLRLDTEGRASELKCNCPRAKKVHRCKHEVAALIAAEQAQKEKSEPKKNNSQKTTLFKELLPTELKEKINKAQPSSGSS